MGILVLIFVFVALLCFMAIVYSRVENYMLLGEFGNGVEKISSDNDNIQEKRLVDYSRIWTPRRYQRSERQRVPIGLQEK